RQCWAPGVLVGAGRPARHPRGAHPRTRRGRSHLGARDRMPAARGARRRRDPAPGVRWPTARARDARGRLTMPSDRADAVFGALSDPTRRQLLSEIAGRPATATELAGSLPISRQAVVKHLGALADAGLIERERA